MYLERAHPAFLTTLVVLVFKKDTLLTDDKLFFYEIIKHFQTPKVNSFGILLNRP